MYEDLPSLLVGFKLFPSWNLCCRADGCVQILCTHALDLLSPGGDFSLLVPDLHKIAMYADAQRSRDSPTAGPLLLLRAEMSADSVFRHFSSRPSLLLCLLDAKVSCLRCAPRVTTYSIWLLNGVSIAASLELRSYYRFDAPAPADYASRRTRSPQETDEMGRVG